MYTTTRKFTDVSPLGFSWRVKKVWALSLPVEKISIKELEWMLDFPRWPTKTGNRLLTASEVINNPSLAADHEIRLKRCDTSYPLDIIKNKQGKWQLLDGLHRLMALARKGEKTVMVRKIPPEMIPLITKDEE